VSLRALWIVLMVLVAVATIAAGLYVADTVLDLWDRLQAAPLWVRALAGVAAGLVTIPLFWMIARSFRRKPRRPAPDNVPSNREELEEAIDAAQTAGVDVAVARKELRDWKRRSENGRIQIVVAGEISSGKSSLIKGLLPDENVEIDVLGGSTQSPTNYEWRSPGGDLLVITDLPGFGAAEGDLDDVSMRECLRAHAVIFLCTGDLTRAEYVSLQRLREIGKPVLVALNKRDRYDEEQLPAVLSALRKKLDALPGGEEIALCSIASGGTEQVTRIDAAGNEEAVNREREPDLEQLRGLLARAILADKPALETLRDGSLLALINDELTRARIGHRRASAENIVRGYTKKAVIGALAAVSPGTDILIQGYLGTAMVRELCDLYEASASEIDVQTFLDLSQDRVRKALPLLLAVAGNGLKAFPGIGTVAGGLVHAVAYGLIFDAMGHGIVQTLEVGGELAPRAAARRFQEELGENLETRTRRLVTLALEARKNSDRA
jgi:GTP-binding protein EngB required for normal cell division